jgi:hypothetical protein
MADKAFIGLLNGVYNIGTPLHFPPEPEDTLAA